LIDLQHMLTGVDNIVIADRVCHMFASFYHEHRRYSHQIMLNYYWFYISILFD